jgi:hypothetical protein
VRREGEDLEKANQDQRNAPAVIRAVIASFQSHFLHDPVISCIVGTTKRDLSNDMFNGSF